MVVERKPQVSDHIERYLRYEDFYFEPILKPLRFSWGPLLSPVPPNQVCRSLKNPFWDLQSLCRQNLRSTSDLCRAYAHNLDRCPCDVLIAQSIVQYDETWNVHSWINNKTVVWAKRMLIWVICWCHDTLPEVLVPLKVDRSWMNGCPLGVSEHLHYPTLAFSGENIASASFLLFAGEALILSLSASFASFSAFFFSASACFVFSSKQRLNILTKLKRIEITATAPAQWPSEKP